MRLKADAQRLPSNMPVMFHSINRSGMLIEVSNEWLVRFGYRREEVIGRKSTDFLTEASRRYAQQVVLPAFFENGFCTDVPYQMVTKGGEIREVLLSATAEMDDAGEVERSLAVLTDVTERKQAERALKDVEEAFSMAFRATATVMVISTLNGGKLVDVNESFERVFGFRRDEVVGREIAQLNLWQSSEDRAVYLRLIQGQEKVRNFEARFRTKSGGNVVVDISGDVIELHGEKCVLSLMSDITERKRAAEEIEVLHTSLAARALELELANDELQAFSYTVSHDLRKPLTAVNGYCQLLLDVCSGTLSSDCRGYLDEIVSGAENMNRLIDTLLELSRVSHVEMNRQSVDLSALAVEVAAQLRASEPGRRAEFVISRGATDYGDPDLLRVVLDNLLGNAWKYTAQKHEARIEFGSAEIRGKRAYFVRDNGVGFDPECADRLFNPFQRLPGSERYQGFGIGLSTVQRIVKRHGGKVWAEGKRGEGAVFYFTVG
jgi:PAS domain S-box-containing protein